MGDNNVKGVYWPEFRIIEVRIFEVLLYLILGSLCINGLTWILSFKK